MNEIVIVGDVHEGKAYDFRVDPLTSVSARAMDLHANLVRAAKHAIEIRASYFVLLGDLFDRTNVAPIFREYVRHDVIEPLGQFGIKILMLAGNHDQPRVFQRGTSIDDFTGYPHVQIFRKPTSIIENIGGKKINFIIMPFLHSGTILDQSEKIAQDMPDDQRVVLGEEILKELVQKYSSEKDCDAQILFAHYYFEGAEISNLQNPEMDVGELEFKQTMLPDKLDLAVFGHVHLFQTKVVRSIPIVFLGSVERIDWGEKKGSKNFMVLNPENMTWKFEQFPTRDMLEIRVKIEAGDKDPTKLILEKIPDDLKDKMVRLIIELPSGMRPSFQEWKIAEKLAPAFNYKTLWNVSLSDLTMQQEAAKALVDPYGLLESYLDLNFSKHPEKDELIKEGKAILKEALEE